MATVKLNNGTRRNSVLGQLVRVDPDNPKNFIAVELNSLDVIGTVGEVRQPGNPTTINLINHPDLVPTKIIIDDYNVLASDFDVMANKATAVTLTLSSATGTNRKHAIGNIGAGQLTVIPYSTDTIESETSQEVSQGECMVIKDIAVGVWKIT